MRVKILLTVNVILISLTISATNTKHKMLINWPRNNVSKQLAFMSSKPPLLQVMSCYVQDNIRFIVLIIVNSNADMVDGLIPLFHKQFQVPILLSRVNIKESTETEISDGRLTCQHCTEVNIVYVIMLDEVALLQQYWDKIQKAQVVWNREAHFVFLVTSHKKTNEAQEVSYGRMLEILWKQHKILHAHILPIFKNVSQVHYQTMIYQPFIPMYNKSFGAIQLIDGEDICRMKDKVVLSKMKNMNGHPFAVSMFEQGKLRSETSNNKVSFYGQDGYILSELAKYMGFTTTILHPPKAKDFGFYYPNGTSTGTLGFVLQGEAEIAFNARFIKDYGIKSIVFTTPIFNDDLCIFVPKANYIPKWLAMVRSFDKDVYAAILFFYVSCASLWYVFKKIINQYCKDKCGKDTVSLFLDNLQPYVGMPFTHIPNTSSERLLMTCSMILGLILVSAFQSQLVTAISKPIYYQDINTLEQLDKSGLRITTSSRNLQDSFANTGNVVLDHLGRKITVVNDSFGRDRVARRGNVAAFVRKSNVESAPVQNSQHSDGSKLVHLVRECPRSYHLSYVMFKNSPYLSKVNRFLIRIFEAGIITQFKSKALNDLKHLDKGNTTTTTKTCHVMNATKVFTIEDLQLPFYLLIVGLALSSFVFLIEKL